MRLIGAASVGFILALTLVASSLGPGVRAQQRPDGSVRVGEREPRDDDARKQRDGQSIFRFDTFDDEQLWTNVLRMHEAIPSVNPVTALAVGLKVDVDALPPALIAALQAGQVDLTDPADADNRDDGAHLDAPSSLSGRPARQR